VRVLDHTFLQRTVTHERSFGAQNVAVSSGTGKRIGAILIAGLNLSQFLAANFSPVLHPSLFQERDGMTQFSGMSRNPLCRKSMVRSWRPSVALAYNLLASHRRQSQKDRPDAVHHGATTPIAALVAMPHLQRCRHARNSHSACAASGDSAATMPFAR